MDGSEDEDDEDESDDVDAGLELSSPPPDETVADSDGHAEPLTLFSSLVELDADCSDSEVEV